MQPTDGYRARPVLITGASGFLGGALALRLTTAGAAVHALSRSEGSYEHEDLKTTLRSVQPDVVFHLAGETSASRDVALVPPTFEANVVTTVNLLTAVADVSPDTRIVLAGSLEEPDVGSGDEPTSPYALSKLAAAAYGSLFHRLYGIPVVQLRVFMAYGPGQRAIGKLVPHVITSLLRDRPVELTAGARGVDWIYVDDVVDAFAAAGLADDAVGQTLDVGSGTTASVREVAEEIARLVGHGELRFGALPDRPRETEPVADPRPAEHVLGWRAATSLRDGLHATVDWYRAALERGDL